MTENVYKRGSEWRKWDLHVHTPLSIEQKYGGDADEVWEKFISSLENLPNEIKVIGINDYYFIEGYEKVMSFKQKGRLKNIDKIFPILEFRIDTFASATENKFSKINLHILFNLDEDNLENEIKKVKEEFIGNIKLSKNHSTEKLTLDNLQKYSSNGKLKTGFSELIPSKEEVLKTINSKQWKDKTFIILGYTEWNNLEKSTQLKPEKKKLYSIANAFFTASESDDTSKKEEVLKFFNDGKEQKSLLHSGDIHDFDFLDTFILNDDGTKKDSEKYKCFTWIKADPTFEGLKQIVYEPEDRVKIQESNPEDEKTHWKLRKMEISDSSVESIFPNQDIVFNSHLTSIIGGRGTGKSALLNLIVFLNGNTDSFIEWLKDRGDLNAKMIFLDKDGSEKVYEVKLSSLDNQSLPMYFLSQEDIEKFSDETQKDEHRSKFLDIIGIDDSVHYYHEETLKAESLITALRKIDQEEIDTGKEIQTIAIDKKVVFDENQKLGEKTTILIEQLKKEKDKYSTKSTKKALNAISKLTIKGNKLTAILNSDLKARISTQVTDLNDLIEKYQSQFDDDFDDGFKKEILKLPKYDILDTSEFIKFTKNNEEKTQKYLDKLRKDCVPYIEILKANGITDYKNITEEIELIDKLIIKLEKYNNRLVEIKIERETVFVSFVTVFDEYKKSIKNAEKDIETKFSEFTNGKSELFNKVFNGIEVSAGIYFNKQEFVDEMQKCFYSGHSKHIEDFVKKLDAQNYESFFNTFNKDFLERIKNQKDSKGSFLKDNAGYYTLIETIYQKCMNKYIYVHPKIKLSDRELGSMSGGQQATLMLKLKLASEGLGKDIIILDQPENHLDNKFINDNLIDLIKILKKEKQVIIASHNANLVVGGDAEEIIISKMDNVADRKYISGSIENPLIKKEIINILEGGKTAFDQRKKKYNL